MNWHKGTVDQTSVTRETEKETHARFVSCTSCLQSANQHCCYFQVANCAPSRPWEDVDGVRIGGGGGRAEGSLATGDPGRNGNVKTPLATPAALHLLQSGFRRVYRWSTSCSDQLNIGPKSSQHQYAAGDLIRFRPEGGVDARGFPSDPDSKSHFSLPKKKFAVTEQKSGRDVVLSIRMGSHFKSSSIFNKENA